MVQENDTLSNDVRLDSQDDGMPPLEIEDSTPPEVVAEEARLLSGTPDTEDVSEPEVETPVDDIETEVALPESDVKGTQPEQPPATEQEPAEQPPQQRTYSQEEWSKMQSTFARQQAEQEKRLKEIEANFQKQQVENQVEAELRRQEQQLAQSVGLEEAQRMTRDTSNVQTVRDAFSARAELEAVRAERNQFEQQSRIGVINNWLSQLQQQHSLDIDDVAELRGLVNPAILQNDEVFVQIGEQMGRLAARLGKSASTRKTVSAERRNIVPAETPETALESGQSISPAPPNDDADMDRILNTPSWDWTDAEAELVNRRGRA